MSDECRACGCVDWDDIRTVNGDTSSVEIRECSECGYEWVRVLQEDDRYV